MDVIVKSNDDSYFYLFKLLSNKNEVKYTDVIPDTVNNLIFSKVDYSGYIKDSNINLEEVLKKKKINKIFVEEENRYLKNICKRYNVKYKVFSNSNYYNEEINKLKSMILLKYILDENKQSIYNLKVLILGDNNLTTVIENLFYKLNTSYDTYNYDLLSISLYKYDIIINTSNNSINPELLFNVKKNLIIYDLESNSKIDHNILDNSFIKYRFINNVSLYLPMAKANILESMCEYDSL